MSCVKSAMAVAESVRGKMNPYYSMCVSEWLEIHQNSTGPLEAISNAFNFGYAQGAKAEKAAQRKRDKESKAAKTAKPMPVVSDYREMEILAI